MLTKRIIPCLDVKNGRVVKGQQFTGLKDAGDPVLLAQKYNDSGADELVFLDITATNEARGTIFEVVEQVAKKVFIPLTVGGGISNMQDVQLALKHGADKVAINSAALANPMLITQMAAKYGSQCVVIAVDVKKVNTDWQVFSHGGQCNAKVSALAWIKEAVKLGAGEVLLTSIDADGSKTGYDLELLQLVTSEVNVPVIASGGAGNTAHFLDLFKQTRASGALAASIFHYDQVNILRLKRDLKQEGVAVRYEME